MEYIFLVFWLGSMAFCTWAAIKIGKSQIIGFGVGMIFPILGPIVYVILLREFKKRGKAEFRIM